MSPYTRQNTFARTAWKKTLTKSWTTRNEQRDHAGVEGLVRQAWERIPCPKRRLPWTIIAKSIWLWSTPRYGGTSRSRTWIWHSTLASETFSQGNDEDRDACISLLLSDVRISRTANVHRYRRSRWVAFLLQANYGLNPSWVQRVRSRQCYSERTSLERVSWRRSIWTYNMDEEFS